MGSLEVREVPELLGTRTTHLESPGGEVGNWKEEGRQPTFWEDPVGWILGVGTIVLMVLMGLGVMIWKLWELFA